MKAQAVDLGICKSALCNVPGNTPVERYDGPGMFCPACGELLQPYKAEPLAQAASPVATPAPATTETAASAAHRKPVRRRAMIGLSAAAAAALIVAGVSFVMADGPGKTIGVCRSNMADRLGRETVAAYVAKGRVPTAHFELRSANCDVTFATTTMLNAPGTNGIVIGHDGIVAIVNPQNRLTQLTQMQLRDIFDGRVTNWANVGGPNAPIVAYLPQAASDESNALSRTVLQRDAVGPAVSRLPTSADVVRAVTAANGRNAIGFVAFSAAVPGKVISIQPFPTPSTLSITDRRYPLTLDVMVTAQNLDDPAVAGLYSYATSPSAKIVAARNGLLP